MSDKIRFNKISGGGFKFEVLRNDRKVGRAYLYILKNDLHKNPFAFIEDVFIEKEYRGQGYGSKMVKVLINKAKKENCYKIICNSRISKEKVHNFYEKMGFDKHGFEFRIDFEKD